MILFEITETENNENYQRLHISNQQRQYSFLESMVAASVSMRRPFLSQQIIKAFNFHAIACLHVNAGEYRPCHVTVGDYSPPAPHRVSALMDDFVNQVNIAWGQMDPIALAAYVLWRLNYIHPFINGNGRTARACCYYVICVIQGNVLPGSETLPELLERNRDAYVDALRLVDKSLTTGTLDLTPLHGLLSQLLREQLKEFMPEDAGQSSSPETPND